MKIDDHPGPQKLSQLLMLRIPHAPFVIDSNK